MKKVIVTGGLGFIGSNLIDLLLKKNFFVINIDKITYSSSFYNTREFKRLKNYRFIKLDIKNNEIHVCQGVNNKLLMNDGLYVEKINWINSLDYKLPLDCLVQVRHQHKPVKCIVDLESGRTIVRFDEQIRAIAPGQSAVFYKDDICLGGGIIEETF